MSLKSLIAVSLLTFSGFVAADTYQAEIGASTTRIDVDSVDSKATKYDATGVYYFNAVKTDGLPLAESAYLGKNSNVFAEAVHSPKHRFVPSTQAYTVGAEFYVPESFLYAQAGVSREKISGETSNDWFAKIGVTPIDGLLISTVYDNDAGYDANLHAKYVTGIGSEKFINLEVGATDTAAGTETVIGGDFYFDRTFSVGVEAVNWDAGDAYTLRTRKFFSDNFSASLSYTNGDWYNSTTLGLNVRF